MQLEHHPSHAGLKLATLAGAVWRGVARALRDDCTGVARCGAVHLSVKMEWVGAAWRAAFLS